MARPKGTTKLEIDPEVRHKIVRFVRAGSYLETAAAAAGVERTTLHRWLKRGAEGEEPFASFSKELDQALAEAELRDLARVDKAAESNWQAAAWKLERRNPKAWGRREYTELTGADGGPVRYEELSEADLDKEIERLTAQLEGEAGEASV